MSLNQIRIDDSELRRKLAAMPGPLDKINKEALESLGGDFVGFVEQLTPTDTNRLVNGWLDAGQKAGVSNTPLRPLKASSRRDQYLKQMQDEMVGFAQQISRLNGWMEYYERVDAQNPVTKTGKPRKKRTNQPYYRKLQRRLAKAEWRLDRVIEEYEKALGSDSFIFFDREAFVQRKSNRAFSTVRDKPYGGDGSIARQGLMWVLRLINREPHGNTVEKHPHLGHPVATAKQLVKSDGIQRVRRLVKSRIRNNTPMGSSRAA